MLHASFDREDMRGSKATAIIATMALAALMVPACNTVSRGTHDAEVQHTELEPVASVDPQSEPPTPEPRVDTKPRDPFATELAGLVYASAHRRTRKILATITPPLVEAAQRRVQLGINAASIRGAWPAPGGKIPDKARARALKRRRYLKPGEIAIIYPKGNASLKLELFDAEGFMNPEAYVKICRALYEPSREPHPIEQPWIAYEPRLLTMLYYAAQHFDAPIEVISSYRTRKRRHKTSNHTRGRAMDIRIKGESLKRRRQVMAYFEKSFSGVGVGWYPRSTFVHVDTRETSWYWTDHSRPGKSGRVRKRKVSRKPKAGTDPTANTIHIPLNKLYQ